MNSWDCVCALSVALPEDIMKLKWAGELEEAAAVIDRRLEEDGLPEILRARLVCEKERLRRLPLQYPWDRAAALEQFRRIIPDMTDEEFALLERQGLVDFIFLHGEKRYFLRFHKSIATRAEYLQRAGRRADGVSPWLDPMIAAIRERGSLRRRITLEASIAVEREAFVPGRYRAWLPVAAESAQQSDVRILAGEPDSVCAPTAPARTVYWERDLAENRPFTVRYSYLSEIRYADPLHSEAPAQPLYPRALPVCAQDLAEDGVYITFTPFLRSLAEELTRGLTRPVDKAWAFYRYVTQQVKYSFVRQYFQIDHIGEYCALNQKGDCGLQAVLFINLCRIAGIPARWQSGLSIDDDGPGDHDWAQFYLDGWGWLFCDPSFGGSAWRVGAKDRHAFYFGNLDPMRMAANRVFLAPLEPLSNALRVDPCDNQEGEIERIGAGLPFVGRQVDTDVRTVSWEEA